MPQLIHEQPFVRAGHEGRKWNQIHINWPGRAFAFISNGVFESQRAAGSSRFGRQPFDRQLRPKNPADHNGDDKQRHECKRRKVNRHQQYRQGAERKGEGDDNQYAASRRQI